MGGPNNLDEVKLFLYNMFSDKNIIPNPIVRPLVRNIIIKKRLNEAKESYAELGGKSPLYDLTMKLIKKLDDKLDMPIYPVMRYVPPFADSRQNTVRWFRLQWLMFSRYDGQVVKQFLIGT